MVIQVVPGQVAEDAHIEVAPIHPFLFQGVGGNLHHKSLGARIGQLFEGSLQFG